MYMALLRLLPLPLRRPLLIILLDDRWNAFSKLEIEIDSQTRVIIKVAWRERHSFLSLPFSLSLSLSLSLSSFLWLLCEQQQQREGERGEKNIEQIFASTSSSVARSFPCCCSFLSARLSHFAHSCLISSIHSLLLLCPSSSSTTHFYIIQFLVFSSTFPSLPLSFRLDSNPPPLEQFN